MNVEKFPALSSLRERAINELIATIECSTNHQPCLNKHILCNYMTNVLKYGNGVNMPKHDAKILKCLPMPMKIYSRYTQL